jgi:hypothetical protein
MDPSTVAHELISWENSASRDREIAAAIERAIQCDVFVPLYIAVVIDALKQSTLDGLDPTTEEEIWRRSKRRSKEIQVAVRSGTATLSGTVESPWEKRALVAVAGKAPGVQEVVDRLVLAASRTTLAPIASRSSAPAEPVTHARILVN